VKLLVDTSVWSLALRRKDTASLSPDEQKLKAELVQPSSRGTKPLDKRLTLSQRLHLAPRSFSR